MTQGSTQKRGHAGRFLRKDQNGPFGNYENTAQKIADDFKVGEQTVKRAERFLDGLNEAEKEKYRNPQTKGGIAMGKVSDEKIILALIATPTIREAAIMCGCSESTIYARLREPEFKARYDVERRGLLERNAAALQSHLGKAIATMAEIVDSKSVSPQVRLNAADAIVRNSLKLNEQTEIIRRVDELEAVVGALEERKR